jgi:FkbM family methyltransferase
MIGTNHKTFVIIGAMDGISHDNIFDKIKDIEDAKIIFVEPIPYHFMQLCENVKVMKGEVYCECTAVSDIKERVEIAYVATYDLHNYEHYISGCSSVIVDGLPINTFMKDVDKSHLSKYSLMTTTFDKLMEKYRIQEVDYLQVDCEGYDERIIDSIDFNEWNIKEVKFEKHYLSDIFYDRLKIEYKNYKSIEEECDITFYL